MISHPEKYIETVHRGYCLGLNELTTHVQVMVDLGFDVNILVTGRLFNLSLPDPQSASPSEVQAAKAMQYRLYELIGDKAVLVLATRAMPFKPMPADYYLSLFYHLEARQTNWHSVEDQLVREGHAAWLDPKLPVPVLE